MIDVDYFKQINGRYGHLGGLINLLITVRCYPTI